MPAKTSKSSSAKGRSNIAKKTAAKNAAKKDAAGSTSSTNLTPDDLLNRNGNDAQSTTNAEKAANSKNEIDKIAELQQELQKAEQSKRVLYNALVRERGLNNDKPSIASAASKTGHNFCKPFTALSADQKKERVRILAGVVAEFADPKGTSTNKSQEVKFVIDELNARWESTPADFQ